jgi:hypothetical protein
MLRKQQTRQSLFDLDAANVFNRAMPVAIMKDAARSNILPPNLRRDVAQAFVRAAMLDDRETAIQAAAFLELNCRRHGAFGRLPESDNA